MKNLKLFLFATLAMFVAITGVNAAKTKYTTLTKLEADEKVTVLSNDGNVKIYKLSSSINENVEIDKSDIIVDLNGNTIQNVKVSADNVTFKDSGYIGSIEKLELNANMIVTNDEQSVLSKTIITNNGTLTVEKLAFVEEIVNSGNLTISGYVNKISVSDGIVNITDDAVLESGNEIHNSGSLGYNYITGGSVVVAKDAKIPAGYFKVSGGIAIYYGTMNFASGTNAYVRISGIDKDEKPFKAVVPRSELKFDVKILDEEEEEVTGTLTKGQVYTISVVGFWNGLEINITDGSLDPSDAIFKVTSGDILVKYEAEDSEPNQYIAIADGVATFEVTVKLANNEADEPDVFKVETDSNHSATAPVEPTEPEKDPGESGGSAVTPGESTDNPTTDETKTPNTVDSIPTYLAAGAVSIMGLALLGFSIKKRMED